MGEKLQEQLLDAQLNVNEKSEHLFHYLAKLGLRRGDEHTYQRLNDILMVHSYSAEALNSFTPKAKWIMKNNVRDNFLKFAKRLQTPSSFCRELPSSSAQLLIEFPQLYANVLGKSPPPPCRLKLLEVANYSQTYSVRNEGGSVHLVGHKRAAPNELVVKSNMNCPSMANMMTSQMQPTVYYS